MFLIGQTDQFTDPNSVMNPQVLIAAKAVELAPNIGSFYQAMGSPVAPLVNDKYEILSRSKTAQEGLLNGAIDAAVTTIVVADASGIVLDMVIALEDELVIVASVDNAANSFTVYERGAGGTTPAVHADAVVFTVNGSAGRDVDLANLLSISESTNIYENYSQLMLEALDYTYTAGILERKGLSPAQIQVILLNEALVRVSERLSKTAILGRKQAGSSSNPRMTAGLINQLSDATGGRSTLQLNAGAVFSEDVLKSALSMLYAKGSGDTIVLSPANKAIANTFNLVNTHVDVATDLSNTRAGSYVANYIYEAQTSSFLVDSAMPDDKIAIVSMNKCTKAWLANDVLRVEDEPNKSSREIRKSIQGSIGFAIENVGTDHIIINNIG